MTQSTTGTDLLRTIFEHCEAIGRDELGENCEAFEGRHWGIILPI